MINNGMMRTNFWSNKVSYPNRNTAKKMVKKLSYSTVRLSGVCGCGINPCDSSSRD